MTSQIRKFTTILVLALLGLPLPAQAETPVRQHLFHIERSKNANIVQYDAQVGADGRLFKQNPVIGYWVRLNEQGQEQGLNWIQRTFAYGFDTKLDKGRESAVLLMKADVGQAIKVMRIGDVYRATITIDGAPSFFEKMYIDATRHGLSLDVRYVELFGADIKTGEPRYEKRFP
jgi:hypothetical protein